MRNLFNKATGTAIAIAAAALLSSGSANAQAVVAKGFPCEIQPNAWSGTVPLFTDDVSHFVESDSGNVNFTCVFDIPLGDEPDKAVKTTDFECLTGPGGAAISQHSISTPGGKVILKCNVHN